MGVMDTYTCGRHASMELQFTLIETQRIHRYYIFILFLCNVDIYVSIIN